MLIQWFLNARSQNFRIFAKTLMKRKKEIINSFIVLKQEYYIDAATGEEMLQEKKMTNAIIENKNAIIKCVKKNANGYTNWGSDSEIGSCMPWTPKPLALFIQCKMKARQPVLVHEASKRL